MSRVRSSAVIARCFMMLACLALVRCGDEPVSMSAGQPANTEVSSGGAGAVANQSAGRVAAGSSAAPAASSSSSSTSAANGVRGSGGSSGRPAAVGGETNAAGAGTAAAPPVAGTATAAPVAGATAMAGAPAAGSGSAATRLPPVTSTAEPGPFETSQDLQAGPSGRSGLFRPSELGKDGIKHPIFVFGCGGGTTPSTYAELLSEVASHGFVVIAEAIEIGDMGAPLRAAIDWITSEATRDGSELNGKLNVDKIALGGHSIGSANGFLIADDPRLTTSIHVAGGSLDMAGNINAPTTGSGGKRLVHPVAYVCSEMDQFGNVEKTMKDYEATTAPAWMTVMTGVDHVGAFREGMAAIIAWLRWQLADESERRAAFLEATGEYNTGRYVSMNKNW